MASGPATTTAPATSAPTTSAPTTSAPTSAPVSGDALNAIDATAAGGGMFTTPNGGHITCDLFPASTAYPDGHVACMTDRIGFTPPPRPASCAAIWGPLVTLTGTAQFGCAEDTIVGQATLSNPRVTAWWSAASGGQVDTPYGPNAALILGQSLIARPLQCTYLTEGVRCENLRTHARFTLSQYGYSLQN